MIKNKNLEIYIHIPFCKRKCSYCDFLSFACSEDVQKRYMDALKKEIAAKSIHYKSYVVTSVFFGGGTPSIVKPMWVKELMELLQISFTMSKTAEITMEMNPGTVTEESLGIYKEAGINRLSMGLQSANDKELVLLGRIHSFEEFLSAYTSARSVGFFNINVDIMSALPGQSVESYTETLEKVLSLCPPPEHISAYSLIVEEGTPFFDAYEKGELFLPSEEEERLMYEKTEEILRRYGYYRYEISNYAKAGYECRHNIGYWVRDNYVGFGLGAASMVDNQRFSGETDMDKYLENPLAERQMDVLSLAEQMEEFMFLGLRLIKGISEEDFRAVFHTSIDEVYGNVIKKHCREGLLKREGGRIFLSSKGLDVSNYVMADFILS